MINIHPKGDLFRKLLFGFGLFCMALFLRYYGLGIYCQGGTENLLYIQEDVKSSILWL